MAEPVVDPARRTWLTITCGAGAVGGVATAVPFVASFTPSERAKAAGAPVEVDISGLKPGEKTVVEWRGKPVWIMRRTPEQLESLKKSESLVADPKSDRTQYPTPDYAKNQWRSIKPELFVAVGICASPSVATSFTPAVYLRAFQTYREALEIFSDAYCIQSRLAVQLNRQGRRKEALEHYRRAYELMPSSFGRVESHCFGCESVFQSAEAQSIAEQVFVDIIRKSPERPQAQYPPGLSTRTAGALLRSRAALARRSVARFSLPERLETASRPREQDLRGGR